MKPKNFIKTLIFAIIVLFTTNANASVPTWNITPQNYQYTMTVTATGKFLCNESTDPNNMIGAFINGTLAGFAYLNTNISGTYYAYITVYSNVSGGDTVSFKLYDAANDTLKTSKYTTVFQENASIGNAATPFVQKTDYELSEISYSSDTIFEYHLTGDSVLVFSVINENFESEIASYSFINDATGTDNAHFSFTDSFLVMAQNVDYLNKDFYDVHIQATNTNGCSKDTSITIYVLNTNTPPTGINPQPASIDENQVAGTFVTQLIAIDASPNDTHIYDITNDTINFPDNNFFSLSQDSLLSTTNFNFEIKDTYILQIRITDNLLGEYIDTFTVDINDLIEFTDFVEDPFYTNENQGPGAFITDITPVNSIIIGIHTYVLTTDTVNFPDNNSFTLNSDSLFSNHNFDFEIKNQYTLQFEVEDIWGTTYLDTFTVYINGLIEFTDFVDNPVNFNENQDSGLVITQFVPAGVLPIDTHTFLLSVDTINFPDNNSFTIQTDSLLSVHNYDFETKNQYTLLIEVRDKWGTFYLDTFIVNINDLVEFTDFVENPSSIDENQLANTLITTLTPIALLATDTHSYILSTDTVNFPDNNHFTLNIDSLYSNHHYDFETQNVYELLIEVRDRFNTTYLDTFIVNINDLVEFTDFVENPSSIDENQLANTLITTLAPIALLATDTHTYVLSTDTVNFPDNNHFTLNIDSLYSNHHYDFETQNVYELLIEVTDKFGTMYLDTFIVNINDLVEFTVFEENPVDFDENQGPDIVVSTFVPFALAITDVHVFTLSSDTTNFPDNNAFTIIVDELTSKENYNYEEKDVYTLLIEVIDKFETMYLDTFIVNILDVDEFTNFEENPLYFDENQDIGVLISSLNPLGSLPNEILDFSLSTDTANFPDNDHFTISGEELLSKEIYNYEIQNEYQILIEVTNLVSEVYLDTINIFINDLIEFDDLKVTNFLSPNNDGINDYFIIPNVELFSEYALHVFNDNGNEVFLVESNYNNNWNGLSSEGKELPSATYYYTFIQKSRPANKFVGKISILRNSKF